MYLENKTEHQAIVTYGMAIIMVVAILNVTCGIIKTVSY